MIHEKLKIQGKLLACFGHFFFIYSEHKKKKLSPWESKRITIFFPVPLVGHANQQRRWWRWKGLMRIYTSFGTTSIECGCWGIFSFYKMMSHCFRFLQCKKGNLKMDYGWASILEWLQIGSAQQPVQVLWVMKSFFFSFLADPLFFLFLFLPGEVENKAKGKRVS